MHDIVFLGGRAFAELNIVSRTVEDLDVLGSYSDVCLYLKQMKPTSLYPIKNGKKLLAKVPDFCMVEAEVAWENSVSEKLLHLIIDDPKTITWQNNNWKFHTPSLNIQYMLKMSHRFLKNSPHFLKTLQDIEMMRYFGAEIEPEHQEFYKLRIKETYNYSHPKLNTSKNDFFKDKQIYVYEHDTIHEAMKHLEKPAYSYFKPDETEVFCDKNLFFGVDEIVRLYSVLEETYVLSLERSQIPHRMKNIPPKISFDKALEKVCTSITSGWFRAYAYDHYYDVQRLYDPKYVDRFWAGVDAGIVKEFIG